MTVLVDWQIREEIESGRLGVDPYDPALINPSSLDIRLGDKFGIVRPTGTLKVNVEVDLHEWRDVPAMDVTRTDTFETVLYTTEVYILKPNAFCLAVAQETFNLPDDISFKLFGKSSWARLGLDNSSAGAWAECGFPGSLVLEIKNLTNEYQVLRAGSKCAQCIFYKHEPAETAYNKHNKSRYVNQTGLQGSKGV